MPRSSACSLQLGPHWDCGATGPPSGDTDPFKRGVGAGSSQGICSLMSTPVTPAIPVGHLLCPRQHAQPHGTPIQLAPRRSQGDCASHMRKVGLRKFKGCPMPPSEHAAEPAPRGRAVGPRSTCCPCVRVWPCRPRVDLCLCLATS